MATSPLPWCPCGISTPVRNVGRSCRRRSNQVCSLAGGSGDAVDAEKDELNAKLAAAEAEAEVLRRELAARSGSTDLSKLKPAIPEKRIDGTGYRETLLGAPGERKPTDWGLSEAGLSSVEPVEKKAEEDDDQSEVVTRRLLIGVGLSAVAIALAFFKLPPGFVKPPRPLPFYLFRILQLKQLLDDIEASNADSEALLEQLESISKSADEWKDVFLSAAAWLEGKNSETASSLAFSIYENLHQADYNSYFDSLGEPSASQKLEFVKFSLQSTKAAKLLVSEFLSLVPRDVLNEVTSR